MTTGSCLCGGVAFAIDGTLSPVQYCHAARCRKSTGSAFAAEVAVEASGFRWIRGEELVRTWEAPLLREPPPYRRAFCGTCGSPLPLPLEGTSLVVMHAGLLDDDPAIAPAWHAFVAEKAPWHTIADPLPRFDRRPPRPG
jgi:hypothetical protein